MTLYHNKEDLRQSWDVLSSSETTTPQNRGYGLEDLLFQLLKYEDLHPTRPYKPRGEQIDGLFEMNGRYFLIEAKWHQDKLPASEVFAFRPKVESKLSGTIGVFIAVNGYAEDVPNILRYGKEINIILFDGEDIEFALQEQFSFVQVLKTKLRHAAQYGEVYYQFQRFLDEEGVKPPKRNSE